MLLESGVAATHIAIITPYSGQRSYVRNLIFNHATRYAAVSVESIDDVQGEEHDYIIFSCVRSNSKKQIGFLANVKRLNVAITRARYGLFILANTSMFRYVPYRDQLIRFYTEKGCMVSGPFSNLKIDSPDFMLVSN